MLQGVSNLLGSAWFRVIHRTWKPFSHLLLVPDADMWSVAWDMVEVSNIAEKIGVRALVGGYGRHAVRQSVFFGSQFELLLTPGYSESSNRLATAYFHGKPGTGVPEFDACFKNLSRFHEKIARIQVTHGEMRDLILSSGIAQEKVFVIPIGINPNFFSVQTSESRRRVRNKLGIPQSAVVVGSFQKDGVGWKEGMEPKMIKGPDVFIKTLEILKTRVPELFVLLAGPARGYVKAELERTGVPYRHYFLKHYPDIGNLYQALDVYIVPSREEGGPKAVLESMASGVPLVTTRVGQAMELVKHGENGWITDVDDVEGLVYWALRVINNRSSLNDMLETARRTAERNSYDSQIPLWRDFMHGFVDCRD